VILRSIYAEGLGCFADAFTAGPFAPGINVLSGPNGMGKSTLMRAVSLAFFEPHRAKSAEMQALRPWGRRLTPQVGVEFEHSGRVYRVRKRFLEGASSFVETREGDSWIPFAQGDSADEFLRELLLTESDKPRSANRENWGVAQVLWTTQGDLSLPPLAASVIESVRSSVGAQLAARNPESTGGWTKNT
jgi:AAA domain